MKKCFVLSTFFSILFLVSCGQSMFGVDEATWNSLSKAEREKVIEGYSS